MATENTSTTSASTEPERVYVEIPRAKPGQGYKAPKNYDNPLLAFVSKLIIAALCLSLPAASGVIFGMILANDPNARTKFLWIWIPLILFIMTIAFLTAYGVAREAWGTAGIRRSRAPRDKPSAA